LGINSHGSASNSPIPTEVVSHSLHSHSQFCVLFPFPWDSRSHWEFHSHAHLYWEHALCCAIARIVMVSLSLFLGIPRERSRQTTQKGIKDHDIHKRSGSFFQCRGLHKACTLSDVTGTTNVQLDSAVVTRLRFDGRSTAYQRSLRSHVTGR